MTFHLFKDAYRSSEAKPRAWFWPQMATRPRVHIATGMYRDGVPVILVEGGHAQLRRRGAHGFDITIYFDEGYIYDWGAMEIRFSQP